MGCVQCVGESKTPIKDEISAHIVLLSLVFYDDLGLCLPSRHFTAILTFTFCLRLKPGPTEPEQLFRFYSDTSGTLTVKKPQLVSLYSEK